MNENELIEYIRGMLSEGIQDKTDREVIVNGIICFDRTQDTDTLQKVILGKIYDHFDNKKMAVAISIRITKKLTEVY